MRTLELREYEPRRAHLTRTQIDELLATKFVQLSPVSGSDEYELRAGSHVGTVVLHSLRLLIRSKVGLRNLFFLLGYGAGLTRWADPQFPYEHEPDLLQAVAWVFEAEVRRALAQGLVRGYQPRQETLSTVRGRIDIAGQIRIRQSQPFPLECRFEDYTEDIELNRVVKAAHHRLLQIPNLDVHLVHRLRFRYRVFDGVTSVDYSRGMVPSLAFTRLNRHWEAAGRLAKLILRRQTLRDLTGAVVGITFTVDMNRLFERFVETVVKEEAWPAGWQIEVQARRKLTPEIPTRPDLISRYSGRDFAVGDAKYKQLEIEEWPHADLYQLLAYCVSLGLPAGLLIYAGARSAEQHTVLHAGVKLEVIGIDLTGGPAEVLSQARTAARRLIAQADAVRRLNQAA